MSPHQDLQSGSAQANAVDIGNARVLIGRGTDNDLVINSIQVSRHHAQISQEGGRYYLTDLNSTNGTCLDGNRISGTVELLPLQWIHFADRGYFFNGEGLVDEEGVAVIWLATNYWDEIAKPLPVMAAMIAPLNGRETVKWFLAALLSVLPVLSFFAEGYRYKIYQDGASGIQALPDYENFGDLFVKGFLFFLVRSVYLVFPALASLALLFIFFGLPNRNAVTEAVFIVIVLVLNLLTWFFIPMSWAHFAGSGKFVAALDFSAILNSIRAVFPLYLTVWLIYIILWCVILVLAMIPTIGWIFAILGLFYIYAVTGLLFGEVYRRSRLLTG
jgi:hypothetical protein